MNEDHVDPFWAMFYLALLPDKPELRNFQDSKVWVKVPVYGMFIIDVFYLC